MPSSGASEDRRPDVDAKLGVPDLHHRAGLESAPRERCGGADRSRQNPKLDGRGWTWDGGWRGRSPRRWWRCCARAVSWARLVLRRVKDPELNLNIVDLGLIYEIHVDGPNVRVDMSLTSPGCPSGPEIMYDAQQQLETIPGIGSVEMNLVWTPPWTPERIEPRVRAYMGF